MSSTYIPASLRQAVIVRANGLCEYCLIHEEDSYFGCQVDHIISEKHGGPTELDNLAYACTFCNRQKGSDVSSIDWESGDFVRFFNPRIDQWNVHFNLNGYQIIPLTPIGRVTSQILDFNGIDRLLERQELQGLNRYPFPEAQVVIGQ